MKILHVISGLSRKLGGPARSSQGLVAALCKHGVDAWIYPIDGTEPWLPGVRKYTQTLSTQTLGHFDLVHIHGIWVWGLHKVAVMCRKAGVPYLISPKGALAPWALGVKRWKKVIALALYQRRDLTGAAAFHATSSIEEKDIRAMGFAQPVILAPNGVEYPSAMPSRTNGGSVRTAIFLSRLHPGKGLLALAEAWARVKPGGWMMKVVGPDSYGHKAEVVAYLERLGILDQWQFVDMLDDTAKWQAYRGADLLVHPSVSENFGITIAEGLAAGLPVIATKGAPWEELNGRRCGWWIEIGVEPLVEALREAFSKTPDELHEMGARGRGLIDDKYTWQLVVGNVRQGYERIIRSWKRD